MQFSPKVRGDGTAVQVVVVVVEEVGGGGCGGKGWVGRERRL